MGKISMLIPDDALAEIDAVAGGNRTAFMVGAALERARRMRRELMDAEISAAVSDNVVDDLAVNRDWEGTLADGLE